MRAILLPIKPEEALNILNGKQTALLRKRVPRFYVGWVYCYVPKGKPYLFYKNGYGHFWTLERKKQGIFYEKDFDDLANGTIPFRFWLDDHIALEYTKENNKYFPKTVRDFNKLNAEQILKRLCLTREEFKQYGNGKDVYVWKIDKLEVFDKPMQLNDFGVENPDGENIGAFGWAYTEEELPRYLRLKKAPKNYQYVGLGEQNE